MMMADALVQERAGDIEILNAALERAEIDKATAAAVLEVVGDDKAAAVVQLAVAQVRSVPYYTNPVWSAADNGILPSLNYP